MSSVLWCVTNGRAAAPPAIGCITGVSTSMKFLRVEVPPDRRHDLRARVEHRARVRVHDQIEIPLAIARLDVAQAVPLLRQRQVALGEKRQARRPDRQLAGARAEQMSADADVIAEVEQREDLEVALGQGVLAEVRLDALAPVGEDEEVRLAEAADRQDPSRDGRLDLRGLERVGRRLAVRRDEGRHRVGGPEVIRIDRNAERLRGPRDACGVRE